MTRAEFERVVAEAFDAIPERFRDKVKNTVVMVEDEVSDEVRREQGLSSDETLLGLYSGVPHTARGSEYGVGETYPDVITIYRKPIEAAAGGNPERIREEVRETVWHEFAHHFGLDEGDIEKRTP